MKSDILEDLLHQELRSLYTAEKETCKALTKMTRVACHPKVRALFNQRLEESEEQAGTLERVAALIGKNLVGVQCQSMKRLVEDEARESLLNAHARNESYEAGLVSAARQLISHEIERYELAAMLASRLGLDEVELLLRKNLSAQKSLLARLTRLAKILKNSSIADEEKTTAARAPERARISLIEPGECLMAAL